MATCTFTPSNSSTSGDDMYVSGTCYQPFIDWAWDAYDFDKDDWDDGFGWETACDVNRPLCRTFDGIWCLTYSADDWWNDGYSSDKPILNWGSRYSRDSFDELDGRCGPSDGKTIARTQSGAGVDNWTQLYLPFFNQAASLRAGTLVHESRHAAGVGHDSGKKDSSWEYNGAWRWQVCWLAWFAFQGTRTSQAMRDLARQRANAILSNNFAKPPGFTV
jgi:hypothetical protein